MTFVHRRIHDCAILVPVLCSCRFGRVVRPVLGNRTCLVHSICLLGLCVVLSDAQIDEAVRCGRPRHHLHVVLTYVSLHEVLERCDGWDQFVRLVQGRWWRNVWLFVFVPPMVVCICSNFHPLFHLFYGMNHGHFVSVVYRRLVTFRRMHPVIPFATFSFRSTIACVGFPSLPSIVFFPSRCPGAFRRSSIVVFGIRHPRLQCVHSMDTTPRTPGPHTPWCGSSIPSSPPIQHHRSWSSTWDREGSTSPNPHLPFDLRNCS